MTNLGFLSKYHTRIIALTIFLLAVIFSVNNYSKNYSLTIKKISSVKSVEKAEAKITSFPKYKEGQVGFEGKITGGEQKELLGINVKVYYKSEDLPLLQPGDTVVVSGNWQSPSPRTNIGGFDGLSFCKSENNHGNIYAKTLSIKTKSKDSLMTHLFKLRETFMQKADKNFDSRYAGVVKALVTGDKSSIDENDSEALKKSGVYHIVAISGMHLNIFIMIFSKFIASLKIKRFKKAILAAFICSFVGMFVLLFTGFGLSVVRAFVMLVISLASAVFARKYSSKNSLLLSAVIILVFIPSSFFNVGFKLSVLSTYGVLLSIDIIKKLKESEKLKKLASVSFVSVFTTSTLCTLLTLPVTINSFGYVSLYSSVANLIILPLMAPALAGCVIFGIPALLGFNTLSKIISYPVSLLIYFILKSANLVSSLPYSTINMYPMYTYTAIVTLVVVLICAYLVFKKRIKPALLLAVILCIAQTGNFLYNNKRNDARVVFADVGQGDCSIVALPKNKGIMFDFGSNSDIYYSLNDIKSTLINLNISKLSAVFVSHFHKDHISGITELVEEGLVKKVFVPLYYDTDDEESIFNRRQLLAVCQKTGTPMIKIDSGDKIALDDALLTVILPTKDMKLEANDMSAVIKMSYGEIDFLFTGDISKQGIKELYNEDIDCDVLKTPHHGSKNSADKIFMEKADPEYAVISCSENNTYGHPHKQTTDLLKENNVKIYRTDKMGAVIFDIDKTKIKSVKTMR